MTCIYCQGRGLAEGVEHVYPEGLGQHQWTLPKGAVCDQCNNYLAQLDRSLVAHPHLMVALMICDVPGKSGKPRRRLGDLERSENGFRVRPPARRTRVETDERSLSIYVDEPTEFEEGPFRRALHKIAFNLLASAEGIEAALDPKYDPVRRYIRAPRRAELWPYAQRILGMRDEMELRFDRVQGAGVVGYRLTLGVDEFFVDLIDPDALVSAVQGNTPDVLVHDRDGTVRVHPRGAGLRTAVSS